MAALAIAQDEKGWLSTETMDFVAGYLDMPPIAVYEVATFYEMYNTEPTGRYKLTICTNLPCALQGASEAAEHLKRKLGVGFGETTAGPDVYAEARRMLRRVRRCAGAAGQQQAHVQLDASGENSIALMAELAAEAEAVNAPAEFLDYGPDAIIMAGLNGRNWGAGRLCRARRLRRAEKDPGREDPAGHRDRRSQEVGAARPRRSGLPHRPQMELHAAAVSPARNIWSAIPTRASRALSRTATSCATTRTS